MTTTTENLLFFTTENEKNLQSIDVQSSLFYHGIFVIAIVIVIAVDLSYMFM